MKDIIKESYKQLIVDTGIEMIEKGITVGTWGNISVRDPETNLVYISPSGMDYSEVEPRHIVVMDLEKNIVEGITEPSIEKHMHIAVFNARKDVNAVIHSHPVYSAAFGAAGQKLVGVSEDFIQIVGEVVQLAEPYALPGTEELGRVAVKCLGSNNAVLLPRHGALIVGSDMKMAFKVNRVLEKNARICLYARILSGNNDLPGFKPEEVVAMQDFAKNQYGHKNRKFSR